MKVRPLILTDETRSEIKRVIAHALECPVSLDVLKRMARWEERPVGDDPKFVCVVPEGYRCVYSHEVQPVHGVCRHLSVSVIGEGQSPNPVAVEALMTEFGFKGGITDADGAWPESIDDKIAINILQRIT